MKIFAIPDTQIRPGDDLSYLSWVGQYLVDKRPDVVVQLGDWADMASLSSYDKGRKSFEGRRYIKDIEAANDGLEILMRPLLSLQEQQRRNKKAVYSPRLVHTRGNHSDRITRAINDDPKLDGTLSLDHIKFRDYGFEVYDFLEPVVIGGVVFCHYLTSGAMGRPIGTAAQILSKRHQSAVVGHQQGLQIATSNRADGKQLTAIIAGSCYLHNEDYLGPQGNNHFRGCVMLHDVDDGSFDPMFVSLKYLQRKYG